MKTRKENRRLWDRIEEEIDGYLHSLSPHDGDQDAKERNDASASVNADDHSQERVDGTVQNIEPPMMLLSSNVATCREV